MITQDVSACYAVFGLIHALWRPVPGRIKDFIAIPRANRYQSLHTTVMGDGGHQFEVQIRTEEMHRIAEEGIAAHWKYKAGDGAVTARDEERLNWIRQLVEWQKEMTDPNEFLSSLKMDLYPDEVYTFTPKGKVVVVPADGTPVDFAYTIHTEVGHTCVGRQGQRPHGAAAHQAAHRRHRRDRHAERPQAEPRLAHLRQESARPQQDQALAQRRHAPPRRRHRPQAAGARSAQVQGADEPDRRPGPGPHRQRIRRGHSGRSAGHAGPGQALRAPDPEQAGSRIRQPGRSRGSPETKPPGTVEGAMSDAVRKLHLTGSDSLQVEGQNDLLVYRARCCNPIRGEEIVGYVTRGKGVAVHARSCPNVQNLLYESDRRIAVEWSRVGDQVAGRRQRYPVKITVFCDDRAGMLKELTAVISDDNTNIRGVDTKQRRDGEAIVEFVVEAEDLRHLDHLTPAEKDEMMSHGKWMLATAMAILTATRFLAQDAAAPELNDDNSMRWA